jgi:peroxiredoxin
MKYAVIVLTTASLALAGCTGGSPRTVAAADNPLFRSESTKVENFRLPDHTGRSYELHRMREAKAVVLYSHSTDCPQVAADLPALKAARDAYTDQGVDFFLLNGNPADGLELLKAHAEAAGIDIPILRDQAQLVTAMLGCDMTGQAVVIDPAAWQVVYRGAAGEPLQAALANVVAGEPVQVARTESEGCAIGFEAVRADVTYAHDVAPIMAEKCVKCHSTGNIAPFSIDDYRDAKRWAPMIREVVLADRMPPWQADPAYGNFANDHSLSPDEARKLLAWVEAGAPKGGEEDPLETAERPFPGFPLGKPDHVITVSEPYTIQADGVLDYVHFDVEVDIEEDKWVKGAHILPGAPEAVHHVLAFIRYPDKYRRLQPQFDGADGFFQAFAPGLPPRFFPDGTAKFLPAGSRLIFQMHYTPVGRELVDQTQMALYFADSPPERELETRSAFNPRIYIPANSQETVDTAVHEIEKDTILYSLMPHLHYRGKWFRYYVEYPDGEQEQLLSVPFWDFNWQMVYTLNEPKLIPAGSKVVCEAAWDNSEGNPYNPDPTIAVHWGDQTFNEMFIGYMDYAQVEPTRTLKAMTQEASRSGD